MEDNDQHKTPILRQSQRTRKQTEFYSPSGGKRTDKSDDTSHAQPNSSPPRSPVAERSFLGRVVNAMKPFGGGKKKGSSTSSAASTASKKADADVQHQRLMTEIQERIVELEEETINSEIILINKKEELDEAKAILDPSHPFHDSACLQDRKKEAAQLSKLFSKETAQHNSLKNKNNAEIKRCQLKLKVLEKEHDADLAHIDEDDEQRLSSDDDDSEADVEELARKLAEWKRNSSPKDESVRTPEVKVRDEDSTGHAQPLSTLSPSAPQTPTSDPITQALLAQSLALTKLLENSYSNKSDKFMARQTTGKDLPHFSGQPEEWPAFIASYKSTTEMCGFSDAENMERLRRCLKGESLKAVQCMMVSPENLPNVLTTLEDRFGQTKQIIQSMIKNACQLTPVKEDKLETLFEFGSAVVNLTATIKSLNSPTYLNNPQLIAELEEKLPFNLRLRWEEWKSSKGTDDDMNVLSEWLGLQLKMAYRMVTFHTKDDTNKEEKKERNAGERKLAVGVHAVDEKPIGNCAFCNKSNHSSYKCRYVTTLHPDERVLLATEKSMCFCCLELKCSARNCPKKRECGLDRCKKTHNRIFHGARPLKEIWASTERNNENRQEVFNDRREQPPVGVQPAPVHTMQSAKLRYVLTEVEGPSGSEVVLALLDDGASIPITEEAIRKNIGATGPSQPLCTSTVNGEGQHPESKIIDVKLKVKFDFTEKYQATQVRTVDDLKLVAVSQDVEALKRRYRHLRNIPLQSFKNVKPRMIIGCSHYRLTCPLRVVEGKPGEPVAVKSRLGWTVVVPDESGVHLVNHTTAQHICDLARDEELRQMVKRSFTTEDFGVKPQIEKLRSKEDQRALDIMKNTTVRASDGIRFQIGQLWKRDDIVLPESKNGALKRLMSQEKKMDRSPEFAVAYCKKMEEYLEKGFIRKLNKSEVEQKSPRTWYLSHFGVLNPNKPGNLRLVFDAAAKSHGVSLNDMMCQGPDLNNSIVSILLRFRQYEVAYAGDIKDMFHRLFMQLEDRHSQRFLWRGMNRTVAPDVYKLQIMMFGAASSPSCAQYDKNMDAKNFEEIMLVSAKVTQKNLCVDDHLQRAPTVQDAEIIKEVMSQELSHRQLGLTTLVK